MKTFPPIATTEEAQELTSPEIRSWTPELLGEVISDLVTQDELTAGLADKVTDAELAAGLSFKINTADLGTPFNPPALNAGGVLEATVTVRRGTVAELGSIVLASGELAVLVDGSNVPIGLRAGDGSTPGGIPVSVNSVGYSGLQFVDIEYGDIGTVFYFDRAFYFVNPNNSQAEIRVGNLRSTGGCSGIAGGFQRLFFENPNNYALGGSNINNWAPVDPNTMMYVTSSAAITITGINAFTFPYVKIINRGTFNITFAHQSASSSVGNRFLSNTGANIVLPPNGMLEIIRDTSVVAYRIFLC